MSKPVCTICGRHETRRVSRKGFWQRVVLYKLGYLPWECVFCRETFFRKA